MAESFNAVSWLVDRHLDRTPAKVAVVTPTEELTYADLARLVARASNALVELGVRAEERVAMIVNDQPEFLAFFLGAMRLGAVPVPLSTMLTASDLGAIVDDSRARAVVISGDYLHHVGAIADRAQDLSAVIVVPATGTRPVTAPPGDLGAHVVHFDEVDDAAERAPARTVADSPAFWLYTSGTTGTPKGAMHRHADLRATAETYGRHVLGIESTDRCFSVAKLFFAYGLGNALTFPLSVGATTILDPAPPTPAGVAATLRRTGPTMFFAVPGFYAAMCDASLDRDLLEGVRRAVSAGEALPAPLHAKIRDRFGVSVLDGIGTTEALHIFLSNHPGAERPGTSGTCVAGYEVKLCDDDGREVTAPDTPGNLFVKGESVTFGYWCRTEATRSALHGHWMRTGDVYSRSDDGYYTFMGRTSDMLKSGGIWVSPAEIESVLLTHDGVLEAAVVGSRNTDGLEQPVAFVVAASGVELDVTDLERHCRAQMAAFKRPREIRIVDTLPKTPTGKVQRYQLRATLDHDPATPVDAADGPREPVGSS